jgi:hypothetical protein
VSLSVLSLSSTILDAFIFIFQIDTQTEETWGDSTSATLRSQDALHHQFISSFFELFSPQTHLLCWCSSIFQASKEATAVQEMRSSRLDDKVTSKSMWFKRRLRERVCNHFFYERSLLSRRLGCHDFLLLNPFSSIWTTKCFRQRLGHSLWHVNQDLWWLSWHVSPNVECQAINCVKRITNWVKVWRKNKLLIELCEKMSTTSETQSSRRGQYMLHEKNSSKRPLLQD